MTAADPLDRPVHGGIPSHGRLNKAYQVRAALLGMVDSLAEEQPIPGERQLAEELSVSRATVRQAVRDLLLEGRLTRRGRHTVAAGPKLVQPLALSSYTEGIRSQGKRPGRIVVGVNVLSAGAATAVALGLGAGDSLVHLERILLADDERVGLESTYLPHSRFPGLLSDFVPAESLYAYFRLQGVVLAEAEERIETVLPAPREAQLIGISPSLPMLLLNRTSRDEDGVPVERVRALYRGDRFSFTTRLR